MEKQTVMGHFNEIYRGPFKQFVEDCKAAGFILNEDTPIEDLPGQDDEMGEVALSETTI